LSASMSPAEAPKARTGTASKPAEFSHSLKVSRSAWDRVATAILVLAPTVAP
jgi:hypothetical protein